MIAFRFFVALLIAGMALPIVAPAEEAKPLLTVKAWAAFTYAAADGQRACFTASAPLVPGEGAAARGRTGLLVSHYPAAKALDQVSVILGFKPDKDGVLVKIGEESFRLDLVAGERAWAKGGATDKAIIAAMQKGDRLILEATAPKSQRVTDIYDLTGFTKTYRASAQACAAGS